VDYHTSQKIRIFLILLEVVITILEMDQKEQVYRKDWDLLIILDACRYDYRTSLRKPRSSERG